MLKTQEITLNMGPQHPSTHGVYRAILTLDGENVVSAKNVLGYLHRGLEKLAESRTYTQFIPFTDRLDYVAGMLNNWGYVMSVEKLLEVEVPERAEYIRVIAGELSRIASHLVFIGAFSLDVAAFTGWMYCWRDREIIMDLLEMISGSRMTFAYYRFGGFPEDVPEEFIPRVKKFVSEFPKALEEYNNLLTGNEILQYRLKNVGILTPDMALDYGVTGPNLRASGVPYDLRKCEPYSVYDRFDFDVPVGIQGDTFDRFYIRIQEMAESVKIIEQAVNSIPEGPVMGKVPKVIKPAVGDAFTRIEGAKGQLGFHVVSDGSAKPYRLHIHSPVFVNLGVFPELVKGTNIQDTVAILASVDLVLGEIDR